MKHLTVIRSAAILILAALVLVAAAPAGRRTPPVPPGAASADSLIRDGERHFAHLWQLTFGGQNAEAYWSPDGTQLIFQSARDGRPCDQQYVLDLRTGATTMVSTGKGRTTCGYFYDGGRRILYASTHLGGEACPPEPDMSQGYTWPVYRSFDIFTSTPDGRDLRRLTDSPDYDAEATLSADGRWIVFTSLREGDIDLYKMRPDGSGLTRLTHEPGYDGGAFFSRDGKWICWRTHHPKDSTETARYLGLLAQNLVKPGAMDLWVMRADGSGKRQVTRDAGASFAPFFTPDGKRLIYSSNKDQPRGRDFNLYLVDVTGAGTPEAVTRDPDFDGFPMFSPDGRWLVFCSNRGGKVAGETNVFLAEWRR